MHQLQWRGSTVLLFRAKFLVGLLPLLSNRMVGKQGGLHFHHLLICQLITFSDYVVYFHLNKAELFKLGRKFNHKAGLSAAFPHYFVPKCTSSAAEQLSACYVVFYFIYNSLFFLFLWGCWKLGPSVRYCL